MNMSASESVAQCFDFSLLPERLSVDLERSLCEGLSAKAVFEIDGDAEELFIAAIARAIRAIEARDRVGLLEEFLEKGPYPDWKLRPGFAPERFMPDGRVAAAIRFIHSSSINAFQGALAEMLAVGPICRIAQEAFGDDRPRVFVGDSVLARKPAKASWAKSADFHLLKREGGEGGQAVSLCGVAEVKSFTTTAEKLDPQLSQHLRRAARGLCIHGEGVPGEWVRLGRRGRPPLKIAVLPSVWDLSRRFRFELKEARTFLQGEEVSPPEKEDQVLDLGDGRWLVTLRWSQEALAAMAYAMTFWYMGELGMRLFAARLPTGAEGMDPYVAGQNAAKQALMYAMLRARSVREKSRAIALYNAYGFGYSLGANFVDKHGRRCELTYADLVEIADTGRSRTLPIDAVDESGVVRTIPPAHCRIRGFEEE